jgi:hypothetical protein
MVKKKLLLALLLSTGVLAWQQGPMATETESTAVVDPCSSLAGMGEMPPASIVVCPRGDGHTLLEAGAWLYLEIKDAAGDPIWGIPGSDFWLVNVDPTGDMVLCGGSGSCDADSATNEMGFTTMRDATIAAGGCADWLSVIVQGMYIMEPYTCVNPLAFEIYVRSPDFDGDLTVDNNDLTTLLSAWPPLGYSACVDLDDDGEIALRDLAYFALHYNHSCE